MLNDILTASESILLIIKRKTHYNLSNNRKNNIKNDELIFKYYRFNI